MADQSPNKVVIAAEMLPLLLPRSVLEDEDDECEQIKLAPPPPPPVMYQNHQHRQYVHRPPRAQTVSPPPPTAEMWLKPRPARPVNVSYAPNNVNKGAFGGPRMQAPNTVNKGPFGGPGMQAVFLNSGKPRIAGTGVFLPRLAGTQLPSPKTPAAPPVLLPARVVNALNLNVHDIGLKQNNNKQQPGQENVGVKNFKGGSGGGGGGGWKKYGGGATGGATGADQWCAAPGIFLPKEWTY